MKENFTKVFYSLPDSEEFNRNFKTYIYTDQKSFFFLNPTSENTLYSFLLTEIITKIKKIKSFRSYFKMTICLLNPFNISHRNFTKMAHKEKPCKLNRSSILPSSKVQNLNKITPISLDNYSIENTEIKNPVMKFNEKDINRLEIQHHLFRIIWNGNFSVPMQHQLSRGRVKVLEVGYVLNNSLIFYIYFICIIKFIFFLYKRSCPSVWTLDMASEYPSSTFIGIENISTVTAASYSKLSSYYSSKISEPRNAAVLQITSMPTSLPFPDETFDLVYHKSSLISPSSQSLHNPFNTLNQLIRVLKPGGWMEFMIIEKQWYNLGPITEYVRNSCKYYRYKKKSLYLTSN
jgi:hypothetical protein